jgi:hypothetical protein
VEEIEILAAEGRPSAREEGTLMDLWLDDEAETASDPMDTVESVIGSDDRFNASAPRTAIVHFSFKTSWGESVGYFSYRHELPAACFSRSASKSRRQCRAAPRR